MQIKRKFPSKIFEWLQQQKNLYYSNIKKRLIGIQDKRWDYMKFRLIQKQEELLPAEGDAMEKLSPFESLHQKIDLFESISARKSAGL